MVRGGEKNQDFYAVLGLKKECSASQLKDAYWKLAKRWHPDRCSALGNLKSIEESKEKFQAIQHAYSVLSDENKRFLYGVGVYKSDDDESINGAPVNCELNLTMQGMADFLNEMGVMMSQNDSKASLSYTQFLNAVLSRMLVLHDPFYLVAIWKTLQENGESLEDLQELFDEIFQGDMEALGNGDSI
ncbi:hypothetical protein SAY87_017270 [Trapa incisa]|uniref:J domain-containing protein n=1 Tax=Trapa incisa TaxID=236973 RepID=A0AAN7LAS6_9MYRT|nr:hypothetical protein SAY87_017270 [Trapa incisa]